MESHQCQLFSKWNAIIMALHKIILFELLLWIQNWNQREFCIPFGSRISNIYSWIVFYMQHTNDVQLLRSLHEKKVLSREKSSISNFPLSVLMFTSIYTIVYLHQAFFFCQNHLTLPFQSLFVHSRWFSIFFVFFFDLAAETSHSNSGKFPEAYTKTNKTISLSFLFNSIRLNWNERFGREKKNLGSSTVIRNALTKEKEHHYKHSTK